MKHSSQNILIINCLFNYFYLKNLVTNEEGAGFTPIDIQVGTGQTGAQNGDAIFESHWVYTH